MAKIAVIPKTARTQEKKSVLPPIAEYLPTIKIRSIPMKHR